MNNTSVALSTLRTLSNTAGEAWRDIVEDVRGLIGESDLAEALEQINDEADDFEVAGYRFISVTEIDRILEEELGNDEYVLGGFNASFLADVTGWPLALIEAAQKAEAYEALGEAIIAEGYLTELASEYARLDGYGHHFASYDGHEHEISTTYLAFRVN